MSQIPYSLSELFNNESNSGCIDLEKVFYIFFFAHFIKHTTEGMAVCAKTFKSFPVLTSWQLLCPPHPWEHTWEGSGYPMPQFTHNLLLVFFGLFGLSPNVLLTTLPTKQLPSKALSTTPGSTLSISQPSRENRLHWHKQVQSPWSTWTCRMFPWN